MVKKLKLNFSTEENTLKFAKDLNLLHSKDLRILSWELETELPFHK